MNRTWFLILAVVVCLFSSFCFGGDTINVKADGTGDYPTIQAAIDDSVSGDEIIVSSGRYYENIDFSGKDIILRSSNPADPNIVDATIIDANSLGSVVTFSGSETFDCILAGFTITDGNDVLGGGVKGNNSVASILNCVIVGNWARYGGGLYRCDGIIEGCTITENSAQIQGGGIYNCSGTIDSCFITYNLSTTGGGLSDCDGIIEDCIIAFNSGNSGGGLYNCDGTITDCTINSNIANESGGGLNMCRGIKENCIISYNSSGLYGGGAYWSSGVLYNCMIIGNTSGSDGGGAYHCSWVRNCTIADNISAGSGGGLSDCYGITSSIVWANSAVTDGQLHSCVTPSYSCIQDWLGGGDGNISDDPLFVDSLNDDYHLLPESSCVDAGNPSDLYYDPNGFDIDGDQRLIGRVDQGVDEVFVVDSAALSVYQNQFNFRAYGIASSVESQMLNVINFGANELNWSVVNDCNWISITPMSGQTQSLQADEITISINNEHLNYGSQSCQFQLIASNAVNSPLLINVELEAYGPFINEYSDIYMESEISDSSVKTELFYIQNSRYDTLNWQVTEDCDWVSLAPLTGQSTGESDEVIVTVDPVGLDVGYHNCEIVITGENASNSPETVSVNLHVYRKGERHVPMEYPTIKEAIDAADDGDHVIVHPGVYSGFGHYHVIYEKDIVLRSVNPEDREVVEKTIISGMGSQIYGIGVASNENQNLSIEGFVFQNFSAPAINCYDSSPVIRNCIFRNNSPMYNSSVVWLKNSSAVIENCEFVDSCLMSQKNSGAVISIVNYEIPDEHVVLRNCLINVSDRDYIYRNSLSSGVYVHGGHLDISNCTIAYNYKKWVDDPSNISSSPGILVRQSNVTINNSIVWGNQADDGSQIGIIASHSFGQFELLDDARVLISNSNIEGGLDSVLVFPEYDAFLQYSFNGYSIDPDLIDPNVLTWGAGNIDVDPLFVREPNDGGDGWFDYWDTPDVDESANNDYGDLHLKSQTGRFLWDGFAGADFNFDKRVDLADFATMAQAWGLVNGTGPSLAHPCNLDGDRDVDLDDLLLFTHDYLEPRVFGEWVADDVTSPCIDAGDSGDGGWQNELWPHGGRINMGAYGRTPQASMSSDTVGNTADLDHDGIVGISDWALFADDWLTDRTLLDSDFDRDNDVDSNDLRIFVDNWLKDTSL